MLVDLRGTFFESRCADCATAVARLEIKSKSQERILKLRDRSYSSKDFYDCGDQYEKVGQNTDRRRTGPANYRDKQTSIATGQDCSHKRAYLAPRCQPLAAVLFSLASQLIKRRAKAFG